MSELALKSLVRLARFYKWAFGDLTASGSGIGVIWEFLVGDALGCLPAERKTQAAFDLVTGKGVSIEVKTTSTKEARKSKAPVYRWYVNDQKTAIESKRPLADVWVFLAAKFPKKKTEIARQLSVFDPKNWICWIAIGEQSRANGCKQKPSEATFDRLGIRSIPFGSLRTEFKALCLHLFPPPYFPWNIPSF